MLTQLAKNCCTYAQWVSPSPHGKNNQKSGYPTHSQTSKPLSPHAAPRATRSFWNGPATISCWVPDNHVSLTGELDGAAICSSTGAMTEAWLTLRLYWRQKRSQKLRLPVCVCLTEMSPNLAYIYSDSTLLQQCLSSFVWGWRVTRWERSQIAVLN